MLVDFARAGDCRARLTLSSRQGRLSLAILLILFFSAAVSRVIIGPMQEALISNLRLSDLDMAWVQGPAISLPGILFSIPVGYLADRISRPRLLGVLVAVNLVGCLVVASAGGLTGIVIGRAISSVPMSIVPVIGLSYAADIFDPSRLGRVNSVLTVGLTLGVSAAFSFGGAFLASTHSPEAWRWLAVILAGPLVLALLSVWRLDDRGRVRRSASSAGTPELARVLWQNRGTIAALIVGFVILVIPEYGAIIWAPPIFARDHGLAVDRVGHLLGLVSLMGGLAGIVMGGALADFLYRPANRARLRSWMLASFVLMLPCLAFGLTASTLVACVLLLVLTILGMLLSVLLQVQAALVLPAAIRGTALSLLTASAALAGPLIGVLAVGLFVGHRSGPNVVGVSFATIDGIALVIGVLLFVPLSRHLARQSNNVG